MKMFYIFALNKSTKKIVMVYIQCYYYIVYIIKVKFIITFSYFEKHQTPYNPQSLTIEIVTQILVFRLGLPNKKSN